MTHPSVNSIVERLSDPTSAWVDSLPVNSLNLDAYIVWLQKQCREAATIISELQAQNEAASINIGSLLASAARNLDRIAELESSLSRIKAETIEAAALVIMSAPDWHTRTSLANLIRSLGSTGGAEKTAESDHSPSTLNTATE